MSESIRVFLADDHAVLRAGLKALLSAEPDMEVIGETGGEEDCAGMIVSQSPDVVLLDINMPCCNGLELLVELRKRTPGSRILVLTMHDDIEYLRQVLATGGAGYVLKEAADTELLTAIRTVHNGGVFLHPEHAALLSRESLEQPSPTRAIGDPVSRLSDRELEVLRLIAATVKPCQMAPELRHSRGVSGSLRFDEDVRAAANRRIRNALASLGWLSLEPNQLVVGLLHESAEESFDPGQRESGRPFTFSVQ